MQPEQQQRILGYFIEEAKDHLTTIEQGLLNLQNTLQDSEMVNEIFRAAHSIKGGAAMLGLNSIQRTAHRFEDFFKILKECQSIQVDHDIESLFLRMFDTLKALVDGLESDSGLTEDVANHLMSEVEPVFDKLQQHLESRVHQVGGGEADLESDFLKSSPPQVFPSSLLSVFQNSVPEILRQMLHLFKQPETQQTRKELEEYCNQLAQLGEQFNLSGWSTLCETAAGAIASSENSYRTLAPIVIKEVKQAQELVLADRANEIATCEQLQALSIKTFLFDWEDTNTTFESQAQQITEMMVVAEQESTELSSIGHNAPESEFLAGISELSTQEQISDWVAEDNLSNLFALNPHQNKQNWQENSAISDFLNLEDDLESSLIEDSGDTLPLISSEETLALNSLFDEAQDTSLGLNTAEPGFCDLFKAPEADLESLDLSEVSTTDSTETRDLSSFWTGETNTPTQSELEKEEFSFSLDANDSFVSSTESFILPIDSFEKNNDVNVINDTATNTSELEQTFDDFGLTELEVDLTTVLECNLSNDSTEFLDTVVDTTPTDVPEITADVESSLPPIAKDLFGSVTFESESSLDLFEEAITPSLTELDFNLDASSSDLFNSDTVPNLELFEASNEVPATDSATELNELDFNLEAGAQDLFSHEEIEPNLELFEASSEVPATDSATELNELDFNLNSSSSDLFNSDTEPNLELFEASNEVPATDSAAELMAGFEPSEMELDLGLDSSSSDLFNSDTEPNLELFEASAEVPATDSAAELMAGFELGATELNFNLGAGAQDLFSHEEVEPNLELAEIESNLELFEASDEVSATDSAAELMAGFELGATELNFNLEAGAQDLFSYEDTLSNLELFEASSEIPVTDSATELSELDFNLEASAQDLFSHEDTAPSLELFQASDEVSASDSATELTELDFSVDSSSSDLFNSDTAPSLELFEASDEVPATDSASELMAGFELGATELDLDLDSSDSELFNSDTTANLELFGASAEVPATDSATELNELNFSLDSSSSDLFNSDTEPNLELFGASAEVPANDSATELIAGFELSATELDLGLDAGVQDLFSHEEIEPNLELFEASAEVPASDSATELNELNFNLDSTDSELFNSDTEPNLELFGASAEVPANDSATELITGFELGATELDLGLDAGVQDLFSHEEIEPNLELFEASAEVPIVENAAELTAALDLIDSAQMALEDELNTVDFEVEERRSQTESIHEELPASAVSDAVTQEEQPNSTALEAETDDFADLEALLNEESISDVLPTFEASIAPDAATVASVTMASATESSNDEFGDLDKLLGETSRETTSATPVQPQQKQTATNSRRSAFEQMMRVPVKQLDSISNQVGELVVYRNSLEQDQERLHQFLDNLLHQVHQLSDVGTRMQELYERSLVEASLLGNRQGSHSPLIDSSASAPKGHVTGINFDALEMDRFTGFHTLAQEMIELIVRVREASSDIEFVTGETEQVARQFRQVTTQLQEGITRSRMVPFSQIAERLPRAVKDISFKYGKQAELQIEGKDTLIDKVILEQLYDPMTHLVNNAITHGIESPEDRAQKGKSPVGQITIRAFHQGNQTVITVSDDGSGIDPERVKAKAIQNGLITLEAANNMSRLDVYNLLFHAGFSTKDKVDEFAGRGVGMDVVLTSLSQMRGTITTDSTLGKGTTFTIRLPLTLSICKALCCLSDKARIAFPMDGVEQMIDIPQEEVITNAEGQSCIPWRDSLLPFRHLREFLTFNRQISRGSVYGSNRDDNMISILVLRSADMFFAIQVDQVLGEQEIVIKQFEAPAPKPAGIAGATILGDGRVMPIADVLELIDLSMGRIRQNEGTWWATNNTSLPSETQPALKTEPMVLIVDDSITVRELLSMTFVNAGYRVEQARDGQEAWDKLRDGLPCDLIFCDIEMPRMDGLELLSRLQQDSKLSQLPISMLTSRGSDRHRQMALQLGASGYFTKPYLEEALLDGAQRMLKGEVLLTPSSSNVNV